MRPSNEQGSEVRLTLVLGGLDAYSLQGGQLGAVVPPLVRKSAPSRRTLQMLSWQGFSSIDAPKLQAEFLRSAAWQRCLLRINCQVGVIGSTK